MGYTTSQVQDAKVIRFITEDKFRILRHVVLLVGLFVILGFSKEVTEYRGNISFIKIPFVYFPLVFLCYVNMYLLVPILFFKGRYVVYFGVLILFAFLSLIVMSNIIDSRFPYASVDFERQPYERVGILTLIILATTLIKLFQRWMRDTQKINELNSINFNMELNELRNQINPHFLFNMLNGIKSLIRTEPEKATTVIMKLSEFLRYQLYENNEKTLIKSEIVFLSNFLELEQLRRDDFATSIDCEIDGHVLNNLFIPPNLFTTFVENAIKHSADISGAGSSIAMSFSLESGVLVFHCRNSKDPSYIPSSKEKVVGLAWKISKGVSNLFMTTHTLLPYSQPKPTIQLN